MPVHCGRLRNHSRAIPLGQAFAQSFAAASAGIGKGELRLFRAMKKSLKALAAQPDVLVEEYHGANHQVTFKGNGTYSRASARCELSDLLVIVYDRISKDARLAYIQAKSERDVPASSIGVAGRGLKANLEQWDLLARRPLLGGVGTFSPPSDLLSGALLPSVGAFAFFLHGSAGVDIYYSAASSLAMPYPCSTRGGKLTALRDMCRCAPIPECQSAYGNAEFGAYLFGMMIGTPVLLAGKPTAPTVCSWLASQLRGLAAQTVPPDASAALASELAELLDPERTPPAKTPNMGARSLLIFGLGPSTRID